MKCNQQCDAGYSADVDDCRIQFNTPADADALTDCIQRARDDYRNCLDDCASAAISTTRSAYFGGGCARHAGPIALSWFGAQLNRHRHSGWPRHQNAPRTSRALA
jgi:hypothetical protein